MDIMCTGVMAAKGRVPHLIFMLLDVLRAFPGQVRRENEPCRRLPTAPAGVGPMPATIFQFRFSLGRLSFAPTSACEPSAAPNVPAGIPNVQAPLRPGPLRRAGTSNMCSFA